MRALGCGVPREEEGSGRWWERCRERAKPDRRDLWLIAPFLTFPTESPEPASWREGPSGHSTLPRSPRDAPCSASSELSGPSTPLHTSSPVQGKERYAEGPGVSRHQGSLESWGWGWLTQGLCSPANLLTTARPPKLQHPTAGQHVPHLGAHSETKSWRGLAIYSPGRR